ncbi:MAG TPA: cytochrome c [Vicinamibacterales bacterium]|nr:cytochrome c [Vicinamibacterales bacterium]
MPGRALVVLIATLVAFPLGLQNHDNNRATEADAVARGRYLVEGVAMCGSCHTPRDQQGSADTGRLLLGGPVPFEPARPTEGWAAVAPRLAGLPPGTDAQFITLMMTGISRTGARPRAPMPQFRMTRADAEATLAYLKSIKPPE